jgi:hypothetical protein
MKWPRGSNSKEIPNPKLQTSNKPQAPNIKKLQGLNLLIATRWFEIWSLKLLWNLELGAWSFSPPLSQFHDC